MAQKQSGFPKSLKFMNSGSEYSKSLDQGPTNSVGPWMVFFWCFLGFRACGCTGSGSSLHRDLGCLGRAELEEAWASFLASETRCCGKITVFGAPFMASETRFCEVLRGLRGGASTKKSTACWGYHLSFFFSRSLKTWAGVSSRCLFRPDAPSGPGRGLIVGRGVSFPFPWIQHPGFPPRETTNKVG